MRDSIETGRKLSLLPSAKLKKKKKFLVISFLQWQWEAHLALVASKSSKGPRLPGGDHAPGAVPTKHAQQGHGTKGLAVGHSS